MASPGPQQNPPPRSKKVTIDPKQPQCYSEDPKDRQQLQQARLPWRAPLPPQPSTVEIARIKLEQFMNQINNMTDLINKTRMSVYDIENKISGIENKISDLENVLPCYDKPSDPGEDELKSIIIFK